MLPDLTDQFIADSYKGVLHTSNVPVSESNLPQVYDGLGNKTSMKIGSDGNGASFSGTLSADNFAIKGFATLIDYLYPIGAIYLSSDNINPQLRFLNTTWQQVSEGKFLAGIGLGNDGAVNKNIVAGNNDGKYSQVLTVAQMPSHTHTGITCSRGSSGETVTSGEPTLLDSRRSMVHQNSGHTSDDDSNKILSLDGQVVLNNTGEGEPIDNCPPSFGVYVWKRIS